MSVPSSPSKSKTAPAVCWSKLVRRDNLVASKKKYPRYPKVAKSVQSKEYTANCILKRILTPSQSAGQQEYSRDSSHPSLFS